MKHVKTITSRYVYDDEGNAVESLGEHELHIVSQRHKGRLAESVYWIHPEEEANRRVQAFALVVARRNLRAFIAEHGHE